MKKVWHEIIAIARTALYFALFFIFLMVFKKLVLEDYQIEFIGLSQALIGALIMSKVVLLMELISLGSWVQRHPPIVDTILRTLLYSLGVLIVVLLEKAFEERHHATGFSGAIAYVLNHRDVHHVWANTLGASVAIFFFNAYSVIQRLLGKHGMYKLFFTDSLNQVERDKVTIQNPAAAAK